MKSIVMAKFLTH